VLKYLDVPPDQIQNPAIQVASAFPREKQVSIIPEDIEPVNYTPPEQHHKLETANDDDKASGLVMPSFYGKTAGEIVQILSKAKLPFRLLGTGTVIQQWPIPGTLLSQDDLCIITLGNSSHNVTQSDRNALRK
jgi:hypothetical protein